MKQIVRIHLLFIPLLLFFSVRTRAQGFLTVNGTRIQNEATPDFILRGMGLGGWMLQEGYMFHLGFLGQQYKIRRKITELIGKKQADLFYEKWLNCHTQKADIDSLAAWGFNSIRLPMHYGLFTLPVQEEPEAGKNTWISTGFTLVDSLLSWCKKDHIYLILDLHAAPGGQGTDLPIADRHPDQPSLWQSRADQDKTVALWRKLAARYRNEPYIGGYDILNETNWGFDDSTDVHGQKEMKNLPLRKLFIRITKAIRSVDKRHIIFLEGNGFANNYHGLFPLWDNNLVISFHKYGNFATLGTIRQYIGYRNRYHVPLWLGESGENSNTWYTDNIRLMEDNDIGWSWWQLKKMGINEPLEIREPKDYGLFVRYCQDSLRLDSAKGQQILDGLLDNIRISRNVWHRDVTDAMFRQVHSMAAIPFKNHVIGDSLTVEAVNYDLGRNGVAYRDKDTSNYRYTPGVHTEGNRGNTYRNDGVDITDDAGGQPVVFSIENGEWLSYTIRAVKAGNYRLCFVTSSGAGQIDVWANGQSDGHVPVAATGGENDFVQSAPLTLPLEKGTNRIKVVFTEGGFELKALKLARQ